MKISDLLGKALGSIPDTGNSLSYLMGAVDVAL